MNNQNTPSDAPEIERDQPTATNDSANDDPPKEIGGRPGPDPTRYGDWEKNGRCIDF
ncbi:MAG: DUF1674 domain-containing protein [Woeseiaceae bacterium]|nr:DUF1674 domain-containing protein [Woeseiaceae bacterium]